MILSISFTIVYFFEDNFNISILVKLVFILLFMKIIFVKDFYYFYE
jgi:hypothetical protein